MSRTYYVLDNFTDDFDTPIADHTMDTGAGWNDTVTAPLSNSHGISSSNRIQYGNSAGTAYTSKNGAESLSAYGMSFRFIMTSPGGNTGDVYNFYLDYDSASESGSWITIGDSGSDTFNLELHINNVLVDTEELLIAQDEMQPFRVFVNDSSGVLVDNSGITILHYSGTNFLNYDDVAIKFVTSMQNGQGDEFQVFQDGSPASSLNNSIPLFVEGKFEGCVIDNFTDNSGVLATEHIMDSGNGWILQGSGNALKSGLEAYWKLDENSGNRADSHKSYTLFDNNTVGSVDGRIGRAAHFNQTSSEYLSNGAFFTPSGSFSFAGWVYPETNATEPYTLLSKTDGLGDSEYKLTLDGTGPYYLRWNCIGGASPAINNSGSLQIEGWNFVYCYLNSGNEIGLSINNNPAATQSTALNQVNQATSANFYLGYDDQGVGDEMQGFLDNWAHWDRLLTQPELDYLYNGGSGVDFFENPYFGYSWTIANNRLVPPAGSGNPIPSSVLYTDKRVSNEDRHTLKCDLVPEGVMVVYDWKDARNFNYVQLEPQNGLGIKNLTTNSVVGGQKVSFDTLKGWSTANVPNSINLTIDYQTAGLYGFYVKNNDTGEEDSFSVNIPYNNTARQFGFATNYWNTSPSSYVDNVRLCYSPFNTIPLFMSGTLATSTENIPLYIDGVFIENSSIPLHTEGIDNHSGEIPLYTQGAFLLNSGVPLYMFGVDHASGEMPLYISGPPVIGNSGNIPLYVLATSGYVSGNNSITLFTSSESDPNYSIPLYIRGEEVPRPTTSNIPLFLEAQAGTPINSSVSLFVKNEQAETTGVIPLYIDAPVPSSLNGNIPLYVSGHGSQNKTIPIYVNGN